MRRAFARYYYLIFDGGGVKQLLHLNSSYVVLLAQCCSLWLSAVPAGGTLCFDWLKFQLLSTVLE